jgi:hypothetical protein
MSRIDFHDYHFNAFMKIIEFFLHKCLDKLVVSEINNHFWPIPGRGQKIDANLLCTFKCRSLQAFNKIHLKVLVDV